MDCCWSGLVVPICASGTLKPLRWIGVHVYLSGFCQGQSLLLSVKWKQMRDLTCDKAEASAASSKAVFFWNPSVEKTATANVILMKLIGKLKKKIRHHAGAWHSAWTHFHHLCECFAFSRYIIGNCCSHLLQSLKRLEFPLLLEVLKDIYKAVSKTDSASP